MNLTLDLEEREQRPACALVFFGQIKNVSPQQADAFVEKVLEPLLAAFPRVDVYFHSYKMSTMTNPRNGERNITIDVGGSTNFFLSKLRSVPGVWLKGIMFSEPEDADDSFWSVDYYLERGDPWDNKGVSMRNLLRQFYSLDRVTQLWWHRRHDYMAVVYTRPDLMFQTTLQFPMPIPDKAILTPTFDRFNGLNDRFAMGSPEVMMIYGQRMRWIEPYFKQFQKSLHAESYLLLVMQKMHQITPQFIVDFKFTRVRANGRMGSTRARLR